MANDFVVEWVPDDIDEVEAYYDQCIGLVLTAVHDDSESIWLHFSDGSAMQFYALNEGGFDMDIHPPENEVAQVAH